MTAEHQLEVSRFQLMKVAPRIVNAVRPAAGVFRPAPGTARGCVGAKAQSLFAAVPCRSSIRLPGALLPRNRWGEMGDHLHGFEFKGTVIASQRVARMRAR